MNQCVSVQPGDLESFVYVRNSLNINDRQEMTRFLLSFTALPPPPSSHGLFVRNERGMDGGLQLSHRKSPLFGSSGRFLQRDGSHGRFEESIACTNT